MLYNTKEGTFVCAGVEFSVKVSVTEIAKKQKDTGISSIASTPLFIHGFFNDYAIPLDGINKVLSELLGENFADIHPRDWIDSMNNQGFETPDDVPFYEIVAGILVHKVLKTFEQIPLW